MVIDRKTVCVFVLAISLGWWFARSPASPVGPPPAPDRPVLKAVGRLARVAARFGLWVALAGEGAPERPKPSDDDRQLVRARAPAIGADGLEELDHAEGW